MILERIKLDKSVREQISIRLNPKARGIVDSFVEALNYLLKFKGSSTTISFAQALETLILANISTNNAVIAIDDEIYKYNDVMKFYIDKKCIKDVDLFLKDKNRIKEYLDKSFKHYLKYAIDTIKDAVDLDDEIGNISLANMSDEDIEKDSTSVYKELEKICNDITCGNEYTELAYNMKEEIAEEFGYKKGVVDYCNFNNYKKDIIIYNNERLEKLIDMYLLKKEKQNTYLVDMSKIDRKGKHLYEDQLERFLESNCTDLSIN